MSGLIGFVSYKNKYPNSLFEMIGDALLTPITTLCGRNTFVVLKNEKTSDRYTYTSTHDSKSRFRVVAELAASLVTLPLAFIGMGFKGLSLITSPETRDIYFNWQTPLETQFNNPDRNNLKNREFNKEASQSSRARRAALVLNTAREVGAKSEIKPTPLKIDFSNKNIPKAAKGIHFTNHALQRAAERGVSRKSILDALASPLKIKEIKINNLGRPTQRFIGKKAEVVIDPKKRQVISVNPTSKKKFKKLNIYKL